MKREWVVDCDNGALTFLLPPEYRRGTVQSAILWQLVDPYADILIRLRRDDETVPRMDEVAKAKSVAA